MKLLVFVKMKSEAINTVSQENETRTQLNNMEKAQLTLIR